MTIVSTTRCRVVAIRGCVGWSEFVGLTFFSRSGWVFAGYDRLSVVELIAPFLSRTLMAGVGVCWRSSCRSVLEGTSGTDAGRCSFPLIIDWRWWRDGGESEIGNAASRLQRRLRVQERSRSQIKVMVLESSSCCVSWTDLCGAC